MGVRCITVRGPLNVLTVLLGSESYSALIGTDERLEVPTERSDRPSSGYVNRWSSKVVI